MEPYALTTPCGNCPFRTDASRVVLRRARVTEIERALIRAEFPCHKTTGADGKVPRGGETTHCAGALILLEKLKRPSQMMRIAERCGLYDPTKLDMKAPVFSSFVAMRRAQPR